MMSSASHYNNMVLAHLRCTTRQFTNYVKIGENAVNNKVSKVLSKYVRIT